MTIDGAIGDEKRRESEIAWQNRGKERRWKDEGTERGRERKNKKRTQRHKKQRNNDLHGLLSRPAYLHGHEAIIDKNLLGQEVGTDSGLVLIAELFVNILVHQRCLSDTICENKKKPLSVTSIRFD